MDIKNLKSQHESVYQEVIETNQYRIGKEDLEGKNVLDIGANNGVFTLLAANYNSKKIVAVESNIGAFDLLQSNTKDYHNIVILNKAASANSGERVKVGRDPEFCAHDGRCYVVADAEGDVETISFNDLLSNFDDESIVLKMDCEGSEYDIIYGTDIKNLKRCSSIFIEMHEDTASVLGKTGLIKKLRSYLIENGFVERWAFDYVSTKVKICRFDLEVPEVTVIISEFLRPEFLVEQIECFQNQTLKPKAIIVWQTQVEGHREAYAFENKYSNVYVIETNHDFNLPGRFAIPSLAKTTYVCLTDDDVFPAPGWLEECYNILKKNNAVVCPYGVRYSSDNCNDLFSKRYGDDGDRCDEPTLVDMGGHAWFGKKEWFSLFWREPVLDEKIADDIHFAHILKKYGINIFVSPYSELNKNAYGNTKPDAGKGIKALHARKWQDEKVWKDLSRVGWDAKDFDYLKSNLDDFSKNREEVVKKYVDLERRVSEKYPTEKKAKTVNTNIEVTCVISTKDRYFSTLPSTLMAIAQQTYKPKMIIVLDDGDFKRIGEFEPIYQTIFQYFLLQGILWIHEPGQRLGQVHNHIKSLAMAKTEWIWRVDDDEIPERDVLEKLISNVKEDVGAIAGLVIPTASIKPLPSVIHNKIEDIYLGYNEQWFVHLDGAKPKEVDHLYSSFLYRKSIASYNTDLSAVGHREETILTYEMKLKGFKNIIDPSAKTWHFRNPSGGIRSHTDVSNYSHDERIFSNKLAEWGVKANDYSYVVLNNGIGDHCMFKSILPEYLKKNVNKKNIFFVCYPELFENVPNTVLASIADAKILFGDELKPYDIYTFMADNRWNDSNRQSDRRHTIDAFKLMYHVDSDVKQVTAKSGTGKTIVISPYSVSPTHAKSYPFWKELIVLLKTFNYRIVQIGSIHEPAIDGVDEVYFGRTFKEIESLINNCRFWISVDNFLPHFCNVLENVIKGVVIFAESDPNLFGYSYNKNILKSRKFLRPYQFKNWLKEEPDKTGQMQFERQRLEFFNKPEEIFIDIRRFLNEADAKSSTL